MVLFRLIADEVSQVEAVVGVDEVDRLLGAFVVLEVVVVTVHHLEELEGVAVALHEAADGIAVTAVPFAPATREVADLVAPEVPCFRDDLDLLLLRELRDLDEERVVGEEALLGHPVLGIRFRGHASEDGGQIEAEAVDVHVVGPVAQRIHDELACCLRGEVELVRGAGCAVDEDVVARHRVVVGGAEAAEAREAGGVDIVGPVAALGGVVVDDVEVDLDPVLVERVDHRAELARGAAWRLIRRVAAVGREVAQGHVAPGVRLAVAVGFGVVRLVDGQEFDGVEPERLQVGGHHGGALVGATVFLGDVHDFLEAGLVLEELAHLRSRFVAGELLDLHLVDHGVLFGVTRFAAHCRGLSHDHALGGNLRGVDEAAFGAVVVVATGAEDAIVEAVFPDLLREDAVRDLTRIRIEEHLVGVETVAELVMIRNEAEPGAGLPAFFVGPVRAPDTETVDGSQIQALQLAAPNAVFALAEFEGSVGVDAEGGFVQFQKDTGGVRCMNCEGDAVSVRMTTEWPICLGPVILLERDDVHGLHFA